MQTLETLIEKIETIRDKKVVFVTGTFDILHTGHINFLKEAKSKGDILIVGITNDEAVKRIKGDDRPIITEDERAKLIEAIKYVDYVFISPLKIKKSELILQIRPDVVVINIHGVAEEARQRIDDMQPKVLEVLPNTEFIILKEESDASTTSIINKIRQL